MEFSYNLSNGSIKVGSKFNSGALRSKELYWREGKYLFAERIFESWDSLYENIDSYIIDSNTHSAHSETFDFKGLATKFSRLSTEEDIKGFASQYGMLGFTAPSPEKAALFSKTRNIAHLDLHTPSVVEPINLWLDSIAQVKRLLKLYRALVKMVKKNVDNIEENLLTTIALHDDCYNVVWKDGHATNVYITELELISLDPLEVYRKVLVNEITQMIDRSNITISPKIIHSSKAPLGMVVVEAPYTSFLITAIYYDLWRMLSEETQIEVCANDECNLPFIKSKNQIYCSDACKQAAYRKRKRA